MNTADPFACTITLPPLPSMYDKCLIQNFPNRRNAIVTSTEGLDATTISKQRTEWLHRDSTTVDLLNLPPAIAQVDLVPHNIRIGERIVVGTRGVLEVDMLVVRQRDEMLATDVRVERKENVVVEGCQSRASWRGYCP